MGAYNCRRLHRCHVVRAGTILLLDTSMLHLTMKNSMPSESTVVTLHDAGKEGLLYTLEVGTRFVM